MEKTKYRIRFREDYFKDPHYVANPIRRWRDGKVKYIKISQFQFWSCVQKETVARVMRDILEYVTYWEKDPSFYKIEKYVEKVEEKS